MNRNMRLGWLGVLSVSLVAGLALRAGAQNTDEEPKQSGAQHGAPMMQCPMMEAMQSLQLQVDSPAVLLAQEKQLQLTDDQKQQLQKIANRARKQANKVLTEEQREQLKQQAPSGTLTPMQLVHVVSGSQMQMMHGKSSAGSDGQGKGKMCPMCMQMMQKMQQQGQSQQRE